MSSYTHQIFHLGASGEISDRVHDPAGPIRTVPAVMLTGQVVGCTQAVVKILWASIHTTRVLILVDSTWLGQILDVPTSHRMPAALFLPYAPVH